MSSGGTLRLSASCASGTWPGNGSRVEGDHPPSWDRISSARDAGSGPALECESGDIAPAHRRPSRSLARRYSRRMLRPTGESRLRTRECRWSFMATGRLGTDHSRGTPDERQHTSASGCPWRTRSEPDPLWRVPPFPAAAHRPRQDRHRPASGGSGRGEPFPAPPNLAREGATVSGRSPGRPPPASVPAFRPRAASPTPAHLETQHLGGGAAVRSLPISVHPGRRWRRPGDRAVRSSDVRPAPQRP